MKTMQELVRPNIWNLKPYSSARDEFQGEASVYLDANENPFHAPYNRYPDPLQRRLKTRVAEVKGIAAGRIFLGNGSDECIDLLMRTFCEPGKDEILTIEPSYGMYQVAADINNLLCRKVRLEEDFRFDAEAFLAAIGPATKIVYLCSPNNPTGNALPLESLRRVADSFEGITVVDEAYIDFSASPSCLELLPSHPNLVVLQTLSKAWAGAGIRLGMAFASEAIISLLSKVKYPYNISLPSQEKAFEILSRTAEKAGEVRLLLNERGRMATALQGLSFVRKVYPSDANFLLVRVDDADGRYRGLVAQGIVVRNRNRVCLCEGCLRITVGSPKENDALLRALGS